ncbi:MAG: hypothetical protein EAZ08_12405 [Cytophagales bacterium]|nr:MAG: hypothetical protein EAZ08_12405 [Cytophagales bacterium]
MIMRYLLAQILIIVSILSCTESLANLFQKIPRDTVSIFDAKSDRRLAVSIRGAYNPNKLQPDLTSAHYGECIDIKMRNMTDSVMGVVLRCGTMLLSRDSASQNMVVTKTLYYTLQPREELFDRVYAMCGQLHKNAPDISIRYDVGALADEPLLKLARVIEKTDSQSKAGQYAVWAVTDGATKDDLGEDFEALQQSQALLNKAKLPINILGKHRQMAVLQKQNKTQNAKPVPTEDKQSISSPNTEIEINVEQISSDISGNLAVSDAVLPSVETEKDEFGSNETVDSINDDKTGQEGGNYWLLFASFSVILFGLYYFWQKKPATKQEKDNLV